MSEKLLKVSTVYRHYLKKENVSIFLETLWDGDVKVKNIRKYNNYSYIVEFFDRTEEFFPNHYFFVVQEENNELS